MENSAAARLTVSVVVLSVSPGPNETIDTAYERLKNTLDSLRDQGLDHKDQVILVCRNDRPVAHARSLWINSGLSGVALSVPPEDFAKSGPQRADGDMILICRDGDKWSPGAIQFIRESFATMPEYNHYFQTALSLTDGPLADCLAQPNLGNRARCSGSIRHNVKTVMENFYYKTPERKEDVPTDTLRAE